MIKELPQTKKPLRSFQETVSNKKTERDKDLENRGRRSPLLIKINK